MAQADWNQARVQQYIDDQVEESVALDYKRAAALQKTPSKKKEITKDVSAMANADGGIIMYGISEHQDRARKHLPERIDPVDRTQFSKEWLEHVIGNIRPRIQGLNIHPVPVDEKSQPDQVVYVVKIPKGTTAHQASDFIYYYRYNFESVPMYDYQVRDVMNRATAPNASVVFDKRVAVQQTGEHHYRLLVKVANLGRTVIRNFKLSFTFPNYREGAVTHRSFSNVSDAWFSLITFSKDKWNDYEVVFRSKHPLFPDDDCDVGSYLRLQYVISARDSSVTAYSRADRHHLTWVLYADDMPPKRGEIPFSQLHNY